MDLRRTLLIALAKKSIYPDDPEKREKILKKYEKYTIPVSTKCMGKDLDKQNF